MGYNLSERSARGVSGGFCLCEMEKIPSPHSNMWKSYMEEEMEGSHLREKSKAAFTPFLTVHKINS